MAAEVVNRLELHFGSAIENVASGSKPDDQDWRSLADMVNMIETLASTGKLDSAEVMPTVNTINIELRAAAARWTAGKGMRVTGQGLEALRDLASIYMQCLRGFTEGEINAAVAQTRRVIRAVQRSNCSTIVQL